MTDMPNETQNLPTDCMFGHGTKGLHGGVYMVFIVVFIVA